MAGCIGDNKFTLIRREETVSHINGNALLPLCREAVHEKREVNFIALCAGFFTVFLNRGELVFINQF